MTTSTPFTYALRFIFVFLLATTGIHSQATTLYSTTFPPTTYIAMQPWAGVDGWLGINTGNAQDDAILDVGGGNLGALLGLDNTNQSNVLSVYRDVPYDPAAQGEPIVILTMRIGFQQSTNGHHDVFSIALFNQNIIILSELVFEPETGSILYYDGTQTTDTGVDLAGPGFVNLRVTIDFEQNLWSASIDGAQLFSDVAFSSLLSGPDLNLGSLDFRWTPTDPMNSGDNYMVVDDINLSANPRFSPDAVPTIQSKRTIKTSKAKVVVKGSATDDQGVAAVQYKGKKGGHKTAKGTVKWKFTAKRLKPGTNRFFVRAVDSTGQTSAPKIIKVKRR